MSIINLKKDEKINLTKLSNGSKNFEIRIGHEDEGLINNVDLNMMADTSEFEVIFWNKNKSKNGQVIIDYCDVDFDKHYVPECMNIDFSKGKDAISCSIFLYTTEFIKNEDFDYEHPWMSMELNILNRIKIEIYNKENNTIIAEYIKDLKECDTYQVGFGSFTSQNGNIYFKAI